MLKNTNRSTKYAAIKNRMNCKSMQWVFDKQKKNSKTSKHLIKIENRATTKLKKTDEKKMKAI